MSSPSRKRLMKDLKAFGGEEHKSIFAAPLENNIHQWTAIIVGPKGTFYENGTFPLLIEFTEQYPQKPPTVKFLSSVYHPNIYKDGTLCLDILKSKWLPTYDLSAILLSIQSLLSDPNADSPANLEAANDYQNNIEEFKKAVYHSVMNSWEYFS